MDAQKPKDRVIQEMRKKAAALDASCEHDQKFCEATAEFLLALKHDHLRHVREKESEIAEARKRMEQAKADAAEFRRIADDIEKKESRDA